MSLTLEQRDAMCRKMKEEWIRDFDLAMIKKMDIVLLSYYKSLGIILPEGEVEEERSHNE